MNKDIMVEIQESILNDLIEDNVKDCKIFKPRGYIKKGSSVRLTPPNYIYFDSKQKYDEYVEYFELNVNKLFDVIKIENNIVTLNSGFKVDIKNLINDDVTF